MSSLLMLREKEPKKTTNPKKPPTTQGSTQKKMTVMIDTQVIGTYDACKPCRYNET